MRASSLRLLFVHSGVETFVALDRAALRQHFIVDDLYMKRKFPAGMIALVRSVRRADLVFCWFASWNSLWALLMAKLSRRPSLLVLGGYDVADLPEAGYGHQRGGLQRWVSRGGMNLATALLPFSEFSRREAESNAGVPPERMQVVYIGVPDALGELPNGPRARMALTVGAIDWPNLKRKGLEPFVMAARLMPDIEFCVVGSWVDDAIEYLRSIAPGNVFFAGRISDEELAAYYRRASVYVQASLHEGFGLSVAEAMLAGCIPVATRMGSLPEVIGGCGVYVDSAEPSDIATGIAVALRSDPAMRQNARSRILSLFPPEKRSNRLYEIVCQARRITS